MEGRQDAARTRMRGSMPDPRWAGSRLVRSVQAGWRVQDSECTRAGCGPKIAAQGRFLEKLKVPQTGILGRELRARKATRPPRRGLELNGLGAQPALYRLKAGLRT